MGGVAAIARDGGGRKGLNPSKHKRWRFSIVQKGPDALHWGPELFPACQENLEIRDEVVDAFISSTEPLMLERVSSRHAEVTPCPSSVAIKGDIVTTGLVLTRGQPSIHYTTAVAIWVRISAPRLSTRANSSPPSTGIPAGSPRRKPETSHW